MVLQALDRFNERVAAKWQSHGRLYRFAQIAWAVIAVALAGAAWVVLALQIGGVLEFQWTILLAAPFWSVVGIDAIESLRTPKAPEADAAADAAS